MKDGEYHLGGGTLLLLMDVNRDPPPVICHGYRPIPVEYDPYLGAITGQGLVDGIIDDLEHHMMQSGAIVRVADIHSGTLSDCVQASEDLDIL
jgi:hypothetical protein